MWFLCVFYLIAFSIIGVYFVTGDLWDKWYD